MPRIVLAHTHTLERNFHRLPISKLEKLEQTFVQRLTCRFTGASIGPRELTK